MSDNYAVARIDGLHTSARGDEVLVLEPDSASWAVMPERHYEVLEALEKPLFFEEILERFPHFDAPFLHRLIDRLHTHGMVEVNWKRHFPLPQVMWRPLDDAPHYPMDFYFHMTDACNFQCTYCYADARTRGARMTLEIIKAAMEKVFRDMPSPCVSFVFHGGEPLLLKPLILEAIEFSEKTSRRFGKHASYSIQTNGSLIDDELIGAALHHRIEIGVTLDGPPALHNRTRVYPDGRGTFDDVWEASQRALAAGVPLGFICIVHDPDDYLKSYQFFTARGILSFNMRFSFAVGRAKQAYQFTPEKAREMAHGALSMTAQALLFYKRTGSAPRINDLNAMIRSLVSKKRDYMCMRSPCGIGRSIIAFGPEGEIYPCEEMSPYREYAFASIFDAKPLTELIDSSEKLACYRSRRVETIPRCSRCPWRRFCMGRCTHKTLQYYGELLREDPSCLFFSTLFEELAWWIHRDRDLLALAE
ncbi:MAG: radical SAM protein [Candidatus Eremiobacteraeota bacterium]|nr:radical SAM protein [Candidatus Eremiobacteraeota bacterium]